jgi:hypothetical protein
MQFHRPPLGRSESVFAGQERHEHVTDVSHVTHGPLLRTLSSSLQGSAGSAASTAALGRAADLGGSDGSGGGVSGSRGTLGRSDNGGEGRSRGGSLSLGASVATSGLGSGGSLGGSGGGGRSFSGSGCSSRSLGGRARVGTRAGRGALPDSRAGDVVGGVRTVEVEDNALVGGGVALVEVELLIRDGGTRASDLNLSARGVELSTTGGVGGVSNVGLVVSNDLLADNVLASLQSRGKSEGGLALGLDELVNSPLLAIVTILGNLGPDSTSTVVLGVGSNVGDDGTLVRAVNDVVATVVVVPLEGELVTGSSLDELGGSLATVDVADEVGAGEVLDGRVAGGRSDVDVASITLVLAVDPEAVDLSVGRDGGGHGQSGSGSGETHLDR